jgi:hypothetical protein
MPEPIMPKPINPIFISPSRASWSLWCYRTSLATSAAVIAAGQPA